MTGSSSGAGVPGMWALLGKTTERTNAVAV